ncbi:conserved hypothetical protein [uncultured Desulfobacterium sp.]|uniref:Uncharacterized protein n=1 Tax=uncultured Desulfobacterium sp. TaxID=201089 RepID=A0A445MYH9_9BACT|nr:conserved hypothetical protein [uncultured Desulfobacterium sp.]
MPNKKPAFGILQGHQNVDQIQFNIIFRKPEYPVIVISANRLYSAFNIKQLAKSCVSSVPIEKNSYIQVIDSSGSEFWYSPEKYILSPGFAFKKWTKKMIIEAFNNSINAKDTSQEYSMKSLSSKRLEKILRDICEMLRP